MSKQWNTTPPNQVYIPIKNKKNTIDKYFDNGGSVKATDNMFTLTYISGTLQGQLKTIKISKEDYELARNGKIDLDELCIKYNIS